jgi:hypothetical protein
VGLEGSVGCGVSELNTLDELVGGVIDTDGPIESTFFDNALLLILKDEVQGRWVDEEGVFDLTSGGAEEPGLDS